MISFGKSTASILSLGALAIGDARADFLHVHPHHTTQTSTQSILVAPQSPQFGTVSFAPQTVSIVPSASIQTLNFAPQTAAVPFFATTPVQTQLFQFQQAAQSQPMTYTLTLADSTPTPPTATIQIQKKPILSNPVDNSAPNPANTPAPASCSDKLDAILDAVKKIQGKVAPDPVAKAEPTNADILKKLEDTTNAISETNRTLAEILKRMPVPPAAGAAPPVAPVNPAPVLPAAVTRPVPPIAPVNPAPVIAVPAIVPTPSSGVVPKL